MQNQEIEIAKQTLRTKYEELNRKLSDAKDSKEVADFITELAKNQESLQKLSQLKDKKDLKQVAEFIRDNEKSLPQQFNKEITELKILLEQRRDKGALAKHTTINELVKFESDLFASLLASARGKAADLRKNTLPDQGAPTLTSAAAPGQEHSPVSAAEAQRQSPNIDNVLALLGKLEKKYESLNQKLSDMDNVDLVAKFLLELDGISQLLAEQNIENRAKLESAKAAGRRDAYTDELHSHIRSFTYEKGMLLSLIDSAKNKEAALRKTAWQAAAYPAPPPTASVEPSAGSPGVSSLSGRDAFRIALLKRTAESRSNLPTDLASSKTSGSTSKAATTSPTNAATSKGEVRSESAPSGITLATSRGSASGNTGSTVQKSSSSPTSSVSPIASQPGIQLKPSSPLASSESSSSVSSTLYNATLTSLPGSRTPSRGSTPGVVTPPGSPASESAGEAGVLQKPVSPLGSSVSPIASRPGVQPIPSSPATSVGSSGVLINRTATSTPPPNRLGETLLAASFSTALGRSSSGRSSPALSRSGSTSAGSAPMLKQEFYPQKVWEEDKILIQQLFAKAEKDGYTSENAMEIAKSLSDLSVKYFLMINAKDFYNPKNFGKPWSSDYPYTQLTSMLETIYDNIIDKASVKKEQKDLTKDDLAKKKSGEKTKKKFFEMCYLISEKFAQESNIALQIPFPGKIVPAIESRFSNVKDDLSDKIIAYFTNLGLEFTLPKLLLNMLQATDHNEVVIPFIGSLKTIVVLQINEKQDRLDDLIAITDLIKAINLTKPASAGENRDEFKNILLKKILPNLFYPLSSQPSIIFTPEGFKVEIPGKETKEYSFEDFDKVLRNKLAVKLKAMYTKKDIDPSSIEISETVIKLVTSEGEVKEYAFEKWEKEMRLLENNIKENKKYVEAVFTPAQLRVAQQYKLDMYQLKLADNNLTQRATMDYITQLREALESKPGDEQLTIKLYENEQKLKSLQEEAVQLKEYIRVGKSVSFSEDIETKIFRKLRLKRALEDVIDIELGTAYPKKDKYEIIKERMRAHMVLSYEILILEQDRLHEIGNTGVLAREEILLSQNRIIEELNTRLTKLKDAIELTPAYLAKDPPANTEKLTEKEAEKIRAEEKVKENEKVKEREKLIVERRKDFITVAYEAIAFQQAKLHEIQSIDNSVREIIPQNQKKLLAEVSNQLTKLKDFIELTPAYLAKDPPQNTEKLTEKEAEKVRAEEKVKEKEKEKLIIERRKDFINFANVVVDLEQRRMQQMENADLSVREESIQKQMGILREVDAQIAKLMDAGVKDKNKDKKSLQDQRSDIIPQLSNLEQMQKDIELTRNYSATIKSKNTGDILIAAGELKVEGRRLLSELAQIKSTSSEDVLMYQQRLKNYILRIEATDPMLKTTGHHSSLEFQKMLNQYKELINLCGDIASIHQQWQQLQIRGKNLSNDVDSQQYNKDGKMLNAKIDGLIARYEANKTTLFNLGISSFAGAIEDLKGMRTPDFTTSQAAHTRALTLGASQRPPQQQLH